MTWTIPGTVLTADRMAVDTIPQQLQAMFLGGGITLSQVSAITGLEPHTVQNWVKRKYVTAPVAKRYSLRQLCRIFNINMLRGVLSLEQICQLLSYVNGELGNEADDMIDDSQLYFLFVSLAGRMQELYAPDAVDTALEQYLQEYREPVPGARERVREVLRIMLTAWLAARLTQLAGQMLNQCQQKGNQNHE